MFEWLFGTDNTDLNALGTVVLLGAIAMLFIKWRSHRARRDANRKAQSLEALRHRGG